jgi:prephenate dehydratase
MQMLQHTEEQPCQLVCRGVAAVASKRAAELYGLEALDEGIQVRFLLLMKLDDVRLSWCPA